jgi:hypothetical protein
MTANPQTHAVYEGGFSDPVGASMYVAAKGGETAIAAAHRFLAEARRGDPSVPELTADQIREQLAIAVSRICAEGSLWDPDLAALALKQARGDMIEAIFLLRAYRATLPRFGYCATHRDVAHGGDPAHLGDLQGHPRRADPRPDFRLHPPPARFRAGRRGRAPRRGPRRGRRRRRPAPHPVPARGRRLCRRGSR